MDHSTKLPDAFYCYTFFVHIAVNYLGSGNYTVFRKMCRVYFLNNSVKCWPILIMFSMQHREELDENDDCLAHVIAMLCDIVKFSMNSLL